MSLCPLYGHLCLDLYLYKPFIIHHPLLIIFNPSSIIRYVLFIIHYLLLSNALASIGSLLIRKVYSSDDTNMPLMYLRKAVSLNSVEAEWELAQVCHVIIMCVFILILT
jgi:hypothetical protein